MHQLVMSTLFFVLKMAYNFKTKKKYNFSVWPTVVIGAGFRSVEIEGIVSYAMASRYADIDALHRACYPYLPEGTPDRPQDYEYVLYTTPTTTGTSELSVIGVPWIKEETIEEAGGVNFNVIIRDESMSSIEVVRLMLQQNNITNFKIEIVEGNRVIPLPS